MFTSIFIAAVIISAFFDQQERRHALELQIEYEKLGRKIPAPPPKLPMLESVANIVVGLILFEIGGAGVLTLLVTMGITGKEAWSRMAPLQTDFAAAFLAGGVALIILGAKGVSINLRFRKIRAAEA
ncbi:MAG: hypothetical protein M1395_09315 [Bacteroidetes bacterium]|jgi:hypothetical protein|nr:hypothetical protein [Bacteroidota bacterium]